MESYLSRVGSPASTTHHAITSLGSTLTEVWRRVLLLVWRGLSAFLLWLCRVMARCLLAELLQTSAARRRCGLFGSGQMEVWTLDLIQVRELMAWFWASRCKTTAG